MPLPPQRLLLGIASARRLLRRAADAPLPPEVALLELTTGVVGTHVAATVADLGIADVVGDDALSTAEIAAKVGADAATLHRLLRAADAFGICSMNARTGAVSMTKMGQVLRSDHPISMRDWARYMGFASTGAAWSGLTDSVRSGESAFARVHGESVWDWFAAHPDEEKAFAGGMRATTKFNREAIAKAYPWPENAAVCDIAGGIGTLLAAILTERHDLRGVLVDAAGVLAEAADFLSESGVSDRVRTVTGNMFEPLSLDAQVFLLKDVLHDWDDIRCAKILNNIASAMPDGGRLVLIEIVQAPNAPNPLAPFVDLQMLTQTDGGRQRSVEELQGLLRDAGLTPTGDARPAVTHTLIDAVK